MTRHVKLGYVGLGNMGAPMAMRLADWPGGLTVFDVRADAMTPLAEAGAAPADSLADVAAADVVSVMVLDDAQVRAVVTEVAAAAKPGTVIAIHSTISDTTAVELARELAPRDVHVIDAPVSGGAAAATKGQLAAMIGAAEDVFTRVKEPFSRWASLIVHAGPPGSGTRMKLARNMITFVSYAAVGEASRLAEAGGLSVRDLGAVVRHTDALTGGAGAVMWRDSSAALDSDHVLYQPFLHARDLGEKDLSLALVLGEAAGVEMPLARLARQFLADGLGVPHTAGST
ncbi:NAD(P)-dependent oxidoreductase [Mycobacterium sp.]|uniref:NAD(P)-dependent oxidoreductase n=1 Tax=Mycobacterium sp. TaxID=1785 RepID=UPI0031D9ABEB